MSPVLLGKSTLRTEQIDVTRVMQKALYRFIVLGDLRKLARQDVKPITPGAEKIENFSRLKSKFHQSIGRMFEAHTSLGKFFQSFLHAFANGQLVALYVYLDK